MTPRPSLVVLSLLLAGCGSDGASAKKPSGSKSPTSSTKNASDAGSTDTSTPAASCGDTGGRYSGDNFCIAPPPDGQGFQIHYGPSDYDNPDDVANYLLDPGGETNLYSPVTSGNDSDVYYYKRQYRMRPGSHHLIVTEGSMGGQALAARRLGGSQNSSKDNPEGKPAPENTGIGIPLKAHDSLTINLHNFNQTDSPILKEAWVNFWYVDASTVTQEANELFLFAPGQSIPPGAHVTFSGKKTVTEETRILTMYGHRHASTVRFDAYVTHGGERKLVLRDFDWEEPGVFEFNSATTNPAPDPTAGAAGVAGAASGDLTLVPGDLIEWECDVRTDTSNTVTYGLNEVAGSEMCILVGDLVGPTMVGLSD